MDEWQEIGLSALFIGTHTAPCMCERLFNACAQCRAHKPTNDRADTIRWSGAGRCSSSFVHVHGVDATHTHRKAGAERRISLHFGRLAAIAALFLYDIRITGSSKCPQTMSHCRLCGGPHILPRTCDTCRTILFPF